MKYDPRVVSYYNEVGALYKIVGVAVAEPRYHRPEVEGLMCDISRNLGADKQQTWSYTFFRVNAHVWDCFDERQGFYLDQVTSSVNPKLCDWLRDMERAWTLATPTPTPTPTPTSAPTSASILAAAAKAASEKMNMSCNNESRADKLKTWTSEVAVAGIEGAKDGTALAAADILIETLEAVILPKMPFLGVYKYNSFTEALGKIVVLWGVGAADRMGFLGDVGVAPVAARAVRALATVHVAPLGLRLIEPLREAMKKVQVLDGLRGK